MKPAVIASAIALVVAFSIYVVQAQPPSESPRGAGERRPPSQDENRRRPEGGGERRERGAARPFPAKSGIVAEFTKNPEGETDGLRLDDGTEIRFRPEAGDKVKRDVAVKDRVTIEGWIHAGESEIHAATIKVEASGKVVAVDRAPPELSSGGERSRRGGTEEEADDRRPPRRPENDDREPRSKPEPSGAKPSPGRPSEGVSARPANPAPAGLKPMPSQRAEPSPFPGFVRIPAGEFDMGDHHGFDDPKHGSDETPIHTVRVGAFDMGIYDVTTQQYCKFLNSALAQKLIEVRHGGVYLVGGKDLLCDTRESSPSSAIGWDGAAFSVLDRRENHPMVCVRWHGAAICCNWLSAQKGLPVCYDTATWDCDFNKSGFRLPTEAEWEYAARGGLQSPYYNYPWGSDADPTRANVPESRNPFRAGPLPWTTPVGFFNGKLQRKADWNWPGDQETFQTADGANGYGLYDMAGNVWQWCTEWYERSYYAYSPAENPPGPAQGSPMPDGKTYRCMRGGSWSNGEFGHSRVSNRDPSYFRGPDPVTHRNDPNGPWFHIGFRMVLPANAESRPAIKPTPVERLRSQDSPAGTGRRPRPDGRTEGGQRREDGLGDERAPRSDAQRPTRSGSFVLRSPAVADGGKLPAEFTADGASATLPLEWTGAPAGTQSYAIIMHHIDPKGEAKWYWILYNIPANVHSLAKNVQGVGTLGTNSVNDRTEYAPPRSKGPGAKTYVYTVYALSAPPRLSVSSSEVDREALLSAMKDRTLGTAELEVVYTRQGDSQRGQDDARDDRRPREDDRQAGDERRAQRSRGERNRGDDGDDRRARDNDREGDGSRRSRSGDRDQGRNDDRGGTRQGQGNQEGRATGGRMMHDNKTPTSPNPGQTLGLFLNTPQACQGYTLFAPKHNTVIYLLDNEGRVVHQWKSAYEPGQSVHLKPNGNLLHCCFTKNRGFTSGGEGGRVEEFDWAGNLVWEFEHSTDQYLSHHDIAPLPNGNILLLVVEKKSYEECIAAGFNPEMLRDRQLFPDSVIEVQPTYPRGGKIVWQWRVWDHLIQDFDRTKANYGDVAAHPELIDVHCNGRAVPAFWNHMNSIAYNAKLDQIVLSVRGCNEIWFLDHSTTTSQAAGHSGGKHGKGGDLIYRWGNPAAYKRGTLRDKQLVQQHDAQWIPDGSPGAGHLTIFNNGYDRGWSSIEEIVPPVDAQGRYVIEPGQPYGPEKPVWRYEAQNRSDFFSSEISGAHRLPNGNTLICAGVIGHLFEVTAAGKMVWQYLNPMVRGGILAQGELPGKDVRGHLFNAVFKVHRYAPDYPGLRGRDLTPKGVIELPASQKGKTGLDGADASPNERRPEPEGVKGARGDDRPDPGRRAGGARRAGDRRGEDRPASREDDGRPRRPSSGDDERRPSREDRS